MTPTERVQGLLADRKHGRILFDRMTRLETAGFQAVHHAVADFVEFVHASKDVRSVALWSDGRVTFMWPDEVPDFARICIEPEDDGMMGRWLSGMPKPTWWQRFKRQPTRESLYALAFPALLLLIVAVTERCSST